MTLEQLLKDGAAPNPNANATVKEAVDLRAFLAPLFPVEGIVANTTKAYPVESAIISIDGYNIPDDAKLYLQLVADDGGRKVHLGVANIQAVRRNQGDQQAATICLDQIVPNWRTTPEIADKVAALKPFVPPPVAVVDPPSFPSPDWTKPRDSGHLAVRVGDHSPDGTKYTAPDGTVFEKGKWLSPFETTWKRL